MAGLGAMIFILQKLCLGTYIIFWAQLEYLSKQAFYAYLNIAWVALAPTRNLNAND